MRRIPVDSSSIASIGYDAERLELEIEFHESGDVYLYFDVPAEVYRDFMAADSKGTYLNQVFKPKGYRYVVVKKGKL
jgi:hypothetical protein